MPAMDALVPLAELFKALPGILLRTFCSVTAEPARAGSQQIVLAPCLRNWLSSPEPVALSRNVPAEESTRWDTPPTADMHGGGLTHEFFSNLDLLTKVALHPG